MQKPNMIRHLVLAIGFCLIPVTGHAFVADSLPDVDTSNLLTFTLFPEMDPFESDEPIRISLEFDMKKFLREKYGDEYQEAVLRYTSVTGSPVERRIRIRSRGDFRRSHCNFPPVKLNFKKTGDGEGYLNDITSLKLVTHCKGSSTYQQYILKEYLVYRMFNILTDNSYRVRLFEIEYVDSEGRRKTLHKYGFIIESHNHLAQRLNALRIERQGIPTWLTEPYQTNLMTLFQYMIGNTDWAIMNQHNIRLFKSADYRVTYPIAIPYDFDYCGMVNADYAVPPEGLGIESVRERVYRGYCMDREEDYQEYIRAFLDHKDELFALVEHFPLLDASNRNEMLEYLGEFFMIVENPKMTRMYIINRCRKIPKK